MGYSYGSWSNYKQNFVSKILLLSYVNVLVQIVRKEKPKNNFIYLQNFSN